MILDRLSIEAVAHSQATACWLDIFVTTKVPGPIGNQAVQQMILQQSLPKSFALKVQGVTNPAVSSDSWVGLSHPGGKASKTQVSFKDLQSKDPGLKCAHLHTRNHGASKPGCALHTWCKDASYRVSKRCCCFSMCLRA